MKNNYNIKLYDVKVKHDKGIIIIRVPASDEESAKKIVIKSENAPESAILDVKEKEATYEK